MNSNVLEVIARYEMDEQQAMAYKIACIYEHLVHKLMPQMRVCTISSGDPRQKELWKYAYKLVTDPDYRELRPDEYKLYVYAQLKVFKAYLDAGKEVLIRPNCLVGDKAWNRWLMFKAKYEQRQRFQTLETSNVNVNPQEKVQRELTATREYFQKRFGKLDKNDIIIALDRGSLQRWVRMQQVSGYYPWLSPVVSKWLDNNNNTVREYFGSALEVYKSGATEETAAFFRSLFQHEYNK